MRVCVCVCVGGVTHQNKLPRERNKTSIHGVSVCVCVEISCLRMEMHMTLTTEITPSCIRRLKTLSVWYGISLVTFCAIHYLIYSKSVI